MRVFCPEVNSDYVMMIYLQEYLLLGSDCC